MTDLNLNELRKVAEAAAELTPGAWDAGDRWVFTLPVYDDDRRLSNIFGMGYANPDREDAERDRARRNVEHVATFDPPTVLALLDRVAELEAKVARVEALAEEWEPMRWSEDGAEYTLTLNGPGGTYCRDLRAALAGESDE